MIKIQIPEFNVANNYKIKHAFLCNVGRSENFSDIIRKNFNNTDFMLLKQTHSNASHVLNRSSYHGREGDAIITKDSGISLCITTADCVPILLADCVNKVVGAVHVGWRGAKSGIINNAVRDMIESGAETITAAIGPTIIQDNYEVGVSFRQQFITDKNFFKEKGGRLFFDLCGYVKEQLLQCGILPQDIYSCGLDTYSNHGIASYRRMQNYDSTNLSLIAIRQRISTPFVEKTEEWINLSSELDKVRSNKVVQRIKQDYAFYGETNYERNNSDQSREDRPAIVYLSDYEEREILKKLRNKKIKIERKIDLHGKNADEAYSLLSQFISDCYFAGFRYLLIIVGKGKNGEGAIRSKLRSWIEGNPKISDKVMLLRESLPEHGGGGSYYVFFRRKKI